MKIFILGYSGHILDFDLAKKLAEAGHCISHTRCSDYNSGNADFVIPENLKDLLNCDAISISSSYDRYNLKDRIIHEIRLAKRFGAAIQEFSPDFVITSNVPLLCSFLLSKSLVRKNFRYIYWWQDVYSAAINSKISDFPRFLPKKFIQRKVRQLEEFIVSQAHATVAISEKFSSLYKIWNLDEDRLVLLPNWTPPEDFAALPHDSTIRGPFVLYAGTLGMKHNPDLLVNAADQIRQSGRVENVIVISEGLGREYLEALNGRPDNLILMNFVSVEELKHYLASAAITLAILESGASEYSVPSKIMTYLAAGKATVAAISNSNPAARYLEDSKSGIVVDPNKPDAFSSSIIHLLNKPDLRIQMGINARRFAENNFSGEKAAKTFLAFMD
jgi:glycosyltransferase involved in cell wall biosynthesis